MENKTSLKKFILHTLNTLFPDPQPSLLHWNTPFQLLVAILLSGNSTDKAVNAVTPKLFKYAPDAFSLSRLPFAQLLSLISPCGLGVQKTQYLLRTSKLIYENYQGIPPASMESLVQLPGVGRKTASVFLSIAHGFPTFPVDTHILRVAQRWKISTKRSPNAAEKDLVRFFSQDNSPKLHLQLIYYARNFCPALHHKQDLCIICDYVSTHSQ